MNDFEFGELLPKGGRGGRWSISSEDLQRAIGKLVAGPVGATAFIATGGSDRLTTTVVRNRLTAEAAADAPWTLDSEDVSRPRLHVRPVERDSSGAYRSPYKNGKLEAPSHIAIVKVADASVPTGSNDGHEPVE
ncbi:MAG: hypothetical protein IT301_03310 [Dehalococcoidia bacterium]|nr:hypothetical protein [Dehalococcoidia bacterium]